MNWETYSNLQHQLLLMKTRMLQIYNGNYQIDGNGIILPNLYSMTAGGQQDSSISTGSSSMQQPVATKGQSTQPTSSVTSAMTPVRIPNQPLFIFCDATAHPLSPLANG